MMWNVDAWREMDRLRKDMDSLFTGYSRGAGPTYPLLNVYDDKDNITVTAELPGMSKDKVNITFSDGLLTIAGKQEAVEASKNMTAIRQERSTGAFEKSLRIPTKVEHENDQSIIQ